jgi:streptogramin lyase
VGDEGSKRGVRTRVGVIILATTLLGGGIVLASGASARSTKHETNRDAVYSKGRPPAATTDAATAVTATSATLNGAVGVGVSSANADEVTSFGFEYGATPNYVSQAGAGSVSFDQSVSAAVAGLTPCTSYHFRLVASSDSGLANGSDQSFTTGFANPIATVKSPGKAKHKHSFKVTISLSSSAAVTVILTHQGHAVNTIVKGVRPAGTVTATLKAPRKKGKYGVRVVAKKSCGQQTVNKKLKVR